MVVRVSETDTQRLIQLELSSGSTRVFRNNVGHAWQGHTFTIYEGRLVRGAARNIAFGLAPGSSDLIGLKSVVITPDMVGRTVAVFTAIEVKDKRKQPTTEQRSFLAMVNVMGGLGGVARSIDDAKRIVSRMYQDAL